MLSWLPAALCSQRSTASMRATVSDRTPLLQAPDQRRHQQQHEPGRHLPALPRGVRGVRFHLRAGGWVGHGAAVGRG